MLLLLVIHECFVIILEFIYLIMILKKKSTTDVKEDKSYSVIPENTESHNGLSWNGPQRSFSSNPSAVGMITTY